MRKVAIVIVTISIVAFVLWACSRTNDVKVPWDHVNSGVYMFAAPENRDDKLANVVFINGLNGEGRASFTYQQSYEDVTLWQIAARDKLLTRSLGRFNLHFLNINTNANMSLAGMANSAFLEVTNPVTGVFRNGLPVIFVGHSLGGLIAMRVVNQLEDDKKTSISGVLFFGTPVDGAWSTIRLSWVGKQLFGGIWEDIRSDNSWLDQARIDFKKNKERLGIYVQCAYEKKETPVVWRKVSIGDISVEFAVSLTIVKKEQMQIICDAPIGLNVNHIDLVKPDSELSAPYGLMSLWINGALSNRVSVWGDDNLGTVDSRRDGAAASIQKALQCALASVGCYSGLIDGRWGSASQVALEEWAKLSQSQFGKPLINMDMLAKVQRTYGTQICTGKKLFPLGCAAGAGNGGGN